MVRNHIYQEVFPLVWVEKQLEKLCPFASSLRLWLVSDARDSSRLLEGQALQEAKVWASDHKINQQEYQLTRGVCIMVEPEDTHEIINNSDVDLVLNYFGIVPS